MGRIGTMVTGLLVAVAATASAQRVMRLGTLHDSAGKDVGRVQMTERNGTVLVEVHVDGLPAGIHGMHLHQAGQCEPPAFQSAGGHYNPHDRMHGRKNPKGPHLGDLGNIRIESNGRGTRTVTMSDSETRKGLVALLGDGRALVIHAGEDDEMTDPSGNSGARIACAVIVP